MPTMKITQRNVNVIIENWRGGRISDLRNPEKYESKKEVWAWKRYTA